MSKLIRRVLLSLVASASAVLLMAPAATASPIGDAEAAIMAMWEVAGGEHSTLGARKGDVYPIGDGFALDFDGGKVFFTPATGAKYLYGPILDKYDSLGGPADSDLGFPTLSETPGLAGPDSRVSTFSASDNPVVFWTPEHGAFIVRGALNAAWDKLGSSGGVLGAPVGDATYEGEVVAQKFGGGEVSWSRKTKEFTTVPAALAEQLRGLQVVVDPAAAINMAWRAAGGGAGSLGAKKGGQYPIGGDGIAQDFTGGKVFFSPATGANAVEGEILAKYESLGGPVGSDLGFPTDNESDGGGGPANRVCAFSAADKPVIFWSPDHGAVVVRGAMKAAWDKLKGPTGKLGAPVGDQAVAGDVVSQRFAGGKISWNRTTNTFTTDPANLAPLLSGLQVPGQNQPSASAALPHVKGFTWHWWYLVGVIPMLLLFAMFALMATGWRRRRTDPETDYQGRPDHDDHSDDGWTHEEDDLGVAERFELDADVDADPAPRVSWPRGAGLAVPGDDVSSRSDEDCTSAAEDFDVVDTAPIPVVSDTDFRETAYPGAAAAEAYADAGVLGLVAPEVVAAEDFAPEDAGVRTGRHAAVDTSADDIEAGTGTDGSWAGATAAGQGSDTTARPTIHLPLEDPYQAPEGYPVKASVRFGLYYTSDSALYYDTLGEIWFTDEEIAQVNGFIKAD